MLFLVHLTSASVEKIHVLINDLSDLIRVLTFGSRSPYLHNSLDKSNIAVMCTFKVFEGAWGRLY
jgi:hypothetical protein